MNRFLALLMSLAWILSFAVSAKPEEPLPNGFRKSTWGMTKEQVKATEDSQPKIERENILIYKGKVAELDADIAFIFADRKLVRAKSLFLAQHTNQNDFISDFDTVKKVLKDKYGSPKKEDAFWSDDLYKDEPQRWGFAVSLGHLSYFSIWDDEKTIITLSLRGENYEISHAVEYLSKQLQHLEDEASKKKQKSDF